MADRTLVQNYILDAQANAAAPKGLTQQIAWLQTQRTPLSEAVNGGDIEVTGRTFDGISSQTRQRIDSKTRLAAVIEAIAQLTAALNGTAHRSRRSILTPRFGSVLS
jgi:hypothetical protein